MAKTYTQGTRKMTVAQLRGLLDEQTKELARIRDKFGNLSDEFCRQQQEADKARDRWVEATERTQS